jgi:hypothetical protein
MSDTPLFPVEGYALEEARIFRPEDWKVARERAGKELAQSTRGGLDWRSSIVRGANQVSYGDWRIVEKSPRGGGSLVDLKATAELSLARWEAEIDARATALLREQRIMMLVAGELTASGRIGSPLAVPTQLEPGQLRYLDLDSRSGEAIAVDPNGQLIYGVTVYDHPWTSAPAASEERATNLDSTSSAAVAANEHIDAKVINRPARVAKRIAEKLEANGYLLSPGDRSPTGLADLINADDRSVTAERLGADRTAIGRHYELVEAVTSAFASKRLGEEKSVDDLANAILPKLSKGVKSKPLAVVCMIVQALLADRIRATIRRPSPTDLKMRHR